MANKVYKSANALLENEYKDLSDEAIDLFGKGQRLEPAKQQRYDQVKQQMAAAAKPNINDILGQWASEGFDESKKPWAGSGGKGVFHQGRFDYQFADDEDFSKPVETSFDFGSASKAKSIAELNNRIKGLGISARVGYPDDDSGNDKIYFERLGGK